MTDTKSQPAVGIDLGTTFSAVAHLDADGRPETIRNSEGDLTTPSAVFFDHQRPIVGMEAVEAGLLEPDRLAQFAKRDVGEKFYDKRIRGKHLPAEVIQALVLRKLKADAELKLGEIRESVITVPAFFNEPCRKATQDAGRLAGLEVLDIINEPTAAAITYGVNQGFLKLDGKSKQRETVLVYDLGGGTFDVTVMQIEEGNFNTIATAGDVYLGGIDWDNRIVDLIAEAFLQEHGLDPRLDPQAEQELLRKANQTKHALTQRESVTVAFANEGRRMRTEITAKEFTERSIDLVERTLMTVHLVLDDANIDWPDLTRLILVGGSTRMPMIREELERMSGMDVDRSLSPDEAVCHGAALYAGMLTAGKKDRSGISVSNVNSHDLGVLAVDPKSDRPRRKIMIPRNSTLPASKMVRFRTHADNQSNVKIQVVEGGDKRGINATRIGKCVVTDIPEGTPKGTSVDVRFDYTADGRLTVHASLPEIDREISMTLDRASGLSTEEIQHWMENLDEGFSDAILASLPDVENEDDSSSSDLTSSSLPDEIASEPEQKSESVQGGEAHTDVSGSDKVEQEPSRRKHESPSSASAKPDAAAVLDVDKFAPAARAKAGNTAEATGTPKNQPTRTDQERSKGSPIKIDLADQAEPKPAITSDDAKSFANALGAQAEKIREKPSLNLDPKDQATAPKADSSDLDKLAALGGIGPAKKAETPDVPFIVTESGSDKNASQPAPGPSRRKSGGFFGRKKK